MSIVETAPNLLDADAVARRLSISRRTVHRLVKSGNLPQPVHINRLARWRDADITEFVASLPTAERTRS